MAYILGTTSRTETSISVSITETTYPASDYTQYAWYKDGSWTAQTTGRSYTFTGLTPDTTYVLGFRAYYIGGTGGSEGWYPSVPSTVTWSTLPQTTPPPTPSSVTLQSRIDAGFNLSWGSSSGATGYEFNYRIGTSGTWNTINTTSTSRTLSNRPYGTEHSFRVRAYNSYGYSGYSNISIATTAPQTPSISLSQVTADSISISVGGVSGGYDNVIVDRLAENNSLIDSKSTSANSTVTWTGLPSETTYRFRARTRLFVNGVNLYSLSYSNIVTVTTGGGRPEEFDWTNPKVQGQPINVTRAEWVAFTNKINEFRDYAGLPVVTFTSVSVGSTITAAVYNQARTAIVQMNPPTPPPSAVSGGSDGTIIAASHFNNIRNSLNSIP